VATVPANAREALDMVRAGLGYLAAADAAQLSAATQAECLRELEQAGAVATAARASVLAGFTAGQGYADDAAYSARSWLIHQTRITSGAAVGHTAWARRVTTHPRVIAALAAGQVSESVGRLISLWTGKLPETFREESDELLGAAAAAGLGLEELASLFAEMYERARGDLPDQDPDRDFADRGLKLATTFGGAGVIHGDLTPPVRRPQQGRLHRQGQPLARRHPRRGRHRRRPHQDLPGLPLQADRQAPRQATRPGRRRQLHPDHHLAPAVRPRRPLHRPGPRLARPPGPATPQAPAHRRTRTALR